jgi:NADH-quinone oxidoreductase subunit A
MQNASAQGVLFVLGLATSAVAFILLVFGMNKLLSPRNPTAEKVEPYECGMPPAGVAHARPKLRFSTIALLFVLFDADAALMFAVAGSLRGSVLAALEVGAFVALLAAGLAYAWRKGALSWPS